jgi:hypothetical protein
MGRSLGERSARVGQDPDICAFLSVLRAENLTAKRSYGHKGAYLIDAFRATTRPIRDRQQWPRDGHRYDGAEIWLRARHRGQEHLLKHPEAHRLQ